MDPISGDKQEPSGNQREPAAANEQVSNIDKISPNSPVNPDNVTANSSSNEAVEAEAHDRDLNDANHADGDILVSDPGSLQQGQVNGAVSKSDDVNITPDANNILKHEEKETIRQLDGDKDESTHQNMNFDDDGDPIPSGTGTVSRDCSASDLVGWSEILPRWHSKLNQRPKGLSTLVRAGIPEPLRGEIWQLLSGAQQCSDLMEQYRIFLTKSAPTEQIILRDVHRTYPAHENFRSGSGSASLLDSLFKVCKAYAVYDEEVGYCQGLSFLVAALLLHMPEEQAFCVFVRIMQDYGLRDLFRNNFDELYLKFYQLERLLEDQIPDLHQHFQRIGVEPFTYASQWFLTVFTAKFPLNAVFYIMDIFLIDGMDTIFQIALALLKSSKNELLALDFEGVLKYFRVHMPKRYRSQEYVQKLIVSSSEISLKKLKKYAKNYEVIKQKEKQYENPVARLQRDNSKLTENNLRLEQENDDLARDLVASKIQLQAKMDSLEDMLEATNRNLSNTEQDCEMHLSTIADMKDEKTRLEVEVAQLKEVCRRELHRAESELARDGSIIADYKRICSQLSKRLDYRAERTRQIVETVTDLLRDNQSCVDSKCCEIFKKESGKLLAQLESDIDDQNVSSSPNQSSGSDKLSKSRLNQPVSSESDPSNRPVGALVQTTLDSQSKSSELKIKQLTDHVKNLEIELARTKLALVEAECKCQQLIHDLNAGATIKTTSTPTQGITSKLDFIKAAMSNRRPVKPGSALTRFNSLISDRSSSTARNQDPSPTSWSLANSIGDPVGVTQKQTSE